MVKWEYCQLVHTIVHYETGGKVGSVLLRRFSPEGTEKDRIYETEVEARPENGGQPPNTKSENFPSDITGYLDIHAEWAERFYGPEGKNTYRNIIATHGSEGLEIIESGNDVYKMPGEAKFTTLITMFKRLIED